MLILRKETVLICIIITIYIFLCIQEQGNHAQSLLVSQNQSLRDLKRLIVRTTSVSEMKEGEPDEPLQENLNTRYA